MSHYSKIFNKVPVQILNKSGFDMSHENLFTATCGTLIPALVDELLPNDTITLGVSSQVQLPPMATDFYGRVDVKWEAFFVPNRILYGGWQDIITHPSKGDNYPSGTTTSNKSKYLPYLDVPATDCGPGTLVDYLGVKAQTIGGTNDVRINNCLPVIAYHKIWDDWYRDSRIQAPLFQRGNDAQYMSFAPYSTNYADAPVKMNAYLADNSYGFSLRQRNWLRDYFTNATPKPQAGDEATLAFNTDTATGEGAFTIRSLRAANALQQWMERNNIAGYRYGDQIKAQFGVYPSDAVTDRCLYLGSVTQNVYQKSVYSTGNLTTSVTTGNPFRSVGSKYSNPASVGNGSLIDKFTATEHGMIFVLFSLVPNALYSTGKRRYLTREKAADFAFPLLSGIGDQEVMKSELFFSPLLADDTFGYTQRYAEYKWMDDEVHGLLRDGSSLAAFALQRTFTAQPTLGSDFLQIPKNYLDGVAAVSGDVSKYGCWVDSYFKYKKSSTLPAYSIPSLGDLHNTHTEMIDNGGKRL